jgi:hypothetical protein
MLRLSNNRFQGQLPDLQLGEVGYLVGSNTCCSMLFSHGSGGEACLSIQALAEGGAATTPGRYLMQHTW